MAMFIDKKRESGQALMTVVLVITVALTVGLSLAGRSIVDVRTSSEEADSQKALAAADAGIEQALVSDQLLISKDFIENQSAYEVNIVKTQGTGPFLLNNGNLIPQGEGIDIWFVDHRTDGTPDYTTAKSGPIKLDIYWGTASDSCLNAALEISVIKNGPPLFVDELVRYTVDPCDDRREENNFSSDFTGGSTIEGIVLQHKWSPSAGAIVGGDTKIYVVRVVPIYGNAIMAVGSDKSLPTQGFDIESTGTAGGASGREVRRSINVFRTYSQLPAVYFNYGLFSP